MAIASYGALLDAVRGVHWPARHAVRSPIPGTHHSKLRGSSAEFTEYRLYRQGDDPRRIDWRLLGRSDRAYVRIATDRAQLPTTVVVDASASMAFPLATRSKWTRAREIAVGLAAVAHADGDPVGVSIAAGGRDSTILPPRTRRGVVSEIARLIDAVDPAGLAPVAPVIAGIRSARIVIITDLLGDADELMRVVRVHIVAGGEAYLIHVVAREELNPPRHATLVADPEEPALQRVLAESSRPTYQRAFHGWRVEMARRWRATGAWYVEVITDEAASHAVRRIADLPAAPPVRR